MLGFLRTQKSPTRGLFCSTIVCRTVDVRYTPTTNSLTDYARSASIQSPSHSVEAVKAKPATKLNTCRLDTMIEKDCLKIRQCPHARCSASAGGEQGARKSGDYNKVLYPVAPPKMLHSALIPRNLSSTDVFITTRNGGNSPLQGLETLAQNFLTAPMFFLTPGQASQALRVKAQKLASEQAKKNSLLFFT